MNAITPPPTPSYNVHLKWSSVDEIDPYLWLEDSAAPAVQQWVQAQHDYTDAVVGAMPEYAAVQQRFTEVARSGLPRGIQAANGIEVYRKTGAGDLQSKLYLQARGGEEKLLLNPEAWDPSGNSAIDWYSLSPDGRYLAYAASQGGREDETLSVVDLQTGRHRAEQIRIGCDRRLERPADTLQHVGPPNSLMWTPDSKAFYYVNFATGLLRHTLGTDPAQDLLVTPADMGEDESMSQDARYVAFSTYVDWATENLNVFDTTSNTTTTLPTQAGCKYRPKLSGGTLYVATNDGAGNSHLMAVDPAQPDRAHWTPVLPEIVPGSKLFAPTPGVPDRGAILSDFAIAQGKILAVYQHNAVARLVQFDTSGTFEREIPLPSLGTVTSIDTDPTDQSVRFTYTALNVPASSYRYTPQDGALTLLHRDQVPGFTPEDYQVTQEWTHSKDGTIFPMFLVRRKDVPSTPATPAVLSGYGGFDIDNPSQFTTAIIPLLERGGTYVQATLRGGHEFGEAWHQDGMLGNKQHVFDDFLAAAHHLVDAGHTAPEHLGIIGGSNGGLLMGAAVAQAPELFKAAVIQVPLLDMLRFDQLTGDAYINEYGTSQNPQQATWLQAWSPYHNLHETTKYPAVIIQSGTNDPRVGPAHARKFAAALQNVTTSGAPVMLREDAQTGHGVGTPVPLKVAELTDAWTVLLSSIRA